MISYYLSDIVSVVLLHLNIVAFETRRGLDVRLRCAGGLQVEGNWVDGKIPKFGIKIPTPLTMENVTSPPIKMVGMD